MFGVEGLVSVADLVTVGRLRPEIARAWQGSLSADSLPGEQYTEPKGDPGLYGPDSVIWRLHGDPVGVLGGITGLILGALHEPTMHGTNKHSVFQDDPLGRLGRTASFISAVTYGGMPVVEKMVTTVRRMHKRVHGTMPDGRPYSATASENIIWTGVTQAHGIVQAHLRYHPDPPSPDDVDRYYAEYAVISEMLGATNVPKSAREVDEYFTEMRPLLTYSWETSGVFKFFGRPFGKTPVAKTASRVIFMAAFDLLPWWAKRLYRIEERLADRVLVRPTTRTLLDLVRASTGESPIRRKALERCAARPDDHPMEVLSQAGASGA